MQRSETYKDHAIVIDDAADPPHVSIDGRRLVVFKRGGLWFTTRLAFNDFETLEQLAHAIVDHRLIPQ